MLDLLWASRRKAPVEFELVAYHLDQAQPGYDGAPLTRWLEQIGIQFEVGREDTYSAVMAEARQDADATHCRLCSRLRRGIMYKAAARLECNKIALGHHRDDALETLLLNLFYAGRLQAMPASYLTNDARFRVIRPLIECGEREIARQAAEAAYPILPCNLCGLQKDLKRKEISRLLSNLEKEIPDLRQVMLASLKNVRPSHLLDVEVAEAWESLAHNYPPRR
jgi:tRNA 2-thiocytidine biosynthesis protein TtcA